MRAARIIRYREPNGHYGTSQSLIRSVLITSLLHSRYNDIQHAEQSDGHSLRRESSTSFQIAIRLAFVRFVRLVYSSCTVSYAAAFAQVATWDGRDRTSPSRRNTLSSSDTPGNDHLKGKLSNASVSCTSSPLVDRWVGASKGGPDSVLTYPRIGEKKRGRSETG